MKSRTHQYLAVLALATGTTWTLSYPEAGFSQDPNNNVAPLPGKQNPGFQIPSDKVPLRPIPKDAVPAHPIPSDRPNKQDLQAQTNLLDLLEEATKSSGAIFIDPEKVLVQPPVLKALITLDDRLSPLTLDANSQTETNLRNVLVTAMDSNLPIKITQTESMMRKWGYYGALGNFLPNLSNEVGFQGISGNYVSPAGLAIPIQNPYLATNNSITQYFYKGGSILHGALQAKYQYRASQQALKGTINDVLMDASKLYYDLVLNDVLLQIRVKAVDVSSALVQVNEDQFANGVNTKLDVLQAKYQLSADRQQLITQQVTRRQSAINLAAALNGDTGIDLDLSNRTIGKTRLIDERLMVSDLLKIAIDNRPELKRYEQLRLAAKEAIKVARAALLPVVAGTGSVVGTGSRVHRNESLSSLQSTPLSSSGPGIGSISSAASLPLSGTGTNSPLSWTSRALFLIGVDVQWNFGGLGIPEIAKVQSAKYDARRIQLEGQQALEKVYQEVRDAYLSSMSAENLIKETTDAVNFAEEKLRVSDTRLREGVGTYLDVINAQRDYTSSLTAKANAITQFNLAQVTILHAMGRLTVDTATSSMPLHQ